ncbi:MAG: hypothetical protein Q4D51_09110 [Eubacteriales bacterium]|nr:hypothetical protein [Eubacteriales bacterium]
MVTYVIAFALTAVVSILIPLIVWGIVIKKNPMERKEVVILFALGALLYVIMQWGIKEHILQYLFNHTNMTQWMVSYYLLYLFLVAFIGAFLFVIPVYLIVRYGLKRQMSFAKATMFGLGYAMTEATMLVGYRCVFTIVGIANGDIKEFDTSVVELYFSSFERVLYLIIYVAVVVGLVYLIEQIMSVRGIVISWLCITFANFLPGFLIAFTTKSYNETFERPIALFLSYLVLTVGALTGIVVMNALKYALKDEKIDSRQAVIAYQRKREQKNQKKEK